VIRERDDAEPSVAFQGSSEHEAFREAGEPFTKALVGAYQHMRSLSQESTHAGGEDPERLFCHMSFEGLPALGQAEAICLPMSDSHSMLLVVHQGDGEGQLPADIAENLVLVARELAKQLHCMLEWQDSPQPLGYPFKQLTEREWYVLRAMTSDGCEKQLAAQLGLSPHTLHTYIKSIYRKIRVQGRLPLLHRLSSAVREMRVEMRNSQGRPAPEAESAGASAGTSY
jgi:DNA-binding CsgD family transcriptional regulator